MKLLTFVFALLMLFSFDLSAQIDSSETKKDVLEIVNIKRATLPQGKPNPFSINSKIEYQIPLNSKSARLVFTDIYGKQIETIKIDHKGFGSFDMDSIELKTGVYSYTLIIDNVAQFTRKCIIE